MKMRFIGILLLVAVSMPTLAQSPYPSTPLYTDDSTTIGTTAVVVAPATTKTRTFIRIQNLSTTSGVYVYCTFNGTTPVAGSPGSILMYPGQTEDQEIQNGVAFSGAITCVSTAASTPLTVWVYPS